MGGACTKPSDDLLPKKSGSSSSKKPKTNSGPIDDSDSDQLSDNNESEKDFDPARLVPKPPKCAYCCKPAATPKVNLLAEIIKIGYEKNLQPEMEMLLTGITRIEELTGISVKQYLCFEMNLNDYVNNFISYSVGWSGKHQIGRHCGTTENRMDFGIKIYGD